MNLSQILLRPVMTEKSVHQEVNSKYSFWVHQAATKVDVKLALKALYGVTVINVNMVNTSVKYRLGRSRKPMEKRRAGRRAIVTLKQGEKLDITRSGAKRSVANAPKKKAKTTT